MSDIHYKLQTFEGPLHMLLEMIESEKLSISEVALSQVTDQFLRHVEIAEREDLSMETIVDFLYVASRLLYVKSKYVLDAMVVAEDEDEVTLEEQLKLFKAYQEASKLLLDVVKCRTSSFARQTMLMIKMEQVGKFQEPIGVTGEKLSFMFGSVLSKLQFIIPRKEVVYAKAVSIREKIDRIKSLLQMSDQMNFGHIIGEQATKTDVVVSFLAMLEMAKQRLVVIEQEEMFREITVKKISHF